MAVLVMVIGQSGSGKSTSLRNFKDNEAFVVNVSGKPMPFRSNSVKVWRSTNYQNITKAISEAPSKSIIIDDSTYLMTTEFMRTAQIKGYDKYTEIACNFYNLLQAAAALPEDKIVYFLGHVDLDANGNERFKTIGKMLDEKVTLEGWFTIVLKTVVQDGKYHFSTQTNGHDTVKSPMGMFGSQFIDNDLKAVDTAIREFYNI